MLNALLRTVVIGASSREEAPTGVRKLLIYLVLLLMAAATIVPFYWMMTSALKPEGEITSPAPTFFPKHTTLENYARLFSKTLYGRWLLNSLVAAGGTTILGLFLCSLGGFGFAKYRFPGSNFLFLVVLGSVAIPQMVTIVPVFALMSGIGLLNTYWVLILPLAPNAFGLFFMRQYISSVPDELLDAGRLDGCSDFALYWRIVLPVVIPGLGALSILLFLNVWGSYLWPLVMTQSGDMFTVPVGLAMLYGGDQEILYGVILAGATLATVPVLILFLGAQKSFIAGLTQGASTG